MKKLCTLLAGLTLVWACSPPVDIRTSHAATTFRLDSGIDRDGMDLSVRPQDDFFSYANGKWIASTEIPADQSYWGSFGMLRSDSLVQLQDIVKMVASDAHDGDAAAKIGDFYNAFLDVERSNQLGMSPIEDLFFEIDALEDHDDIAAFFGSSNVLGLDAPFNLYIDQDDKDPDHYIIFMTQSGLGLPNRDYYLEQSERDIELRDQYRQFIERALDLSGYHDSDTAADDILALETKLARHQWDKVANRDADKTYNKFGGGELGVLLSELNVDGYFAGIGSGLPDHVIVRQPSYLEEFNEVFRTTPLATWKVYLRLQALISYGSFLSEDFVAANFEFFSKALRGRAEQRARWKRAITSINSNLGELLGQLYVERHFPAEARTRMVELVSNLIRAYAESINELEWMSDETRVRALAKLHKFTPKIGYPDVWKDYTALKISDDDLVGNIKRARSFAHYRELDKLGKAVDRGEWFMAPQMVNAYYNPAMNEIVFPAAILHPPFFDLNAEDARNYGAIGAVIGHEIGHGFDDQGSKYDGDGYLKNWWTKEDRKQFESRTDRLVSQYDGFEALPGQFVDGELTLGENIGDLGGVAIAYRAYGMSLNGEKSPIIDGFTGAERFFLGFAQAWRSKYRDQALELLIRSNPHSPPVFRVNGVVSNIDSFYETFGVNQGDAHYLPPEERVKIW